MNIKPIRKRSQPQTECSKCPVRKLALFQGVPVNSLGWTQQFREQQLIVPPKAILYQEGTRPGYVYTLFNGWMAMYQTSKSGKRQILRFALPGDFIGFQADSSGMISHSISAITKSIVCTFPRDSVRELLKSQPTLPLRLASMEASDMRVCQHHQAFSRNKDSRTSIAFLLLELFHRSRQKMQHQYDPEDNSIAFPLTQEDIGDAVGLTNIHVNRVLREFQKSGLIECRKKKLIIYKEENLTEIGEFDKGIINKGDYFSMLDNEEKINKDNNLSKKGIEVMS